MEPGMILLLYVLNGDPEAQTVIDVDVLVHVMHTFEHLDLQWDLADGKNEVRYAIPVLIII